MLNNGNNDRKALKQALAEAKLEVEKVLAEVDTMDAMELARLKGATPGLTAFVDFNSGCK